MYRGKAYKYRCFHGLTDKSKLRIEEMLVNAKCYFSAPSKLNDPFDCKPILNIDVCDLRKYMHDISRSNGIKPKAGVLTKAVVDAKERYDDEYFFNMLDQKVSVYCLSQKPNLATQWAYYGGDHTGFCIEYEIDERFSHPVERVEYTKDRPKVDLIQFQKNDGYRLDRMREISLTKSESWSHEEEVRILGKEAGLYSIPKESISGVVFGLRANPKHVEFVASLVELNKLDIQLYQCVISNECYSMALKKI